MEIRGVAPVDSARCDEVTFLSNPRYRADLARSDAGAVILGPREPSFGKTALRVDDPYRSFVEVLTIFDQRIHPEAGIHPTALISSSAKIGDGAYIGPYVVIGEHTTIGSRARIHPHVTIYSRVTIGDRFTAHAGVVVRERVTIGDDVTLQPGVVLGGDGFGFLPRKGEHPLGIPHLGQVTIGHEVDIGANTTVDRATIGVTRLGNGVKVDNLVMIAHGCDVGDASLLAGQFGMAGSSKLGRRVMAGGQSGVSGHLRVGDDVRIAAQSGVASDVSSGETVGGSPAIPIALWRRCSILFRDLPDLARRLRSIGTAQDDTGRAKSRSEERSRKG